MWNRSIWKISAFVCAVMMVAGAIVVGTDIKSALCSPGQTGVLENSETSITTTIPEATVKIASVALSVAHEEIPAYTGATQSQVPDSLRLKLNIVDTLNCEGYLTEAAPEEVMDWYQEHMGDWMLDYEASFSPPDLPEVLILMHYYKKGEDGAFIFAQGGFMDKTLIGIATGPWTLVQQCGGYEGPPTEGEMINFRYPIDLDDIDYEGGGIGPFGMHAGDHSEGLDHIWVYCKSAQTPARATADGVVEYISGGPGKWQVIVKHSERFKSEYYLLNEVLVQENQEVTKGDTIGYPIPVETWVHTHFFDYWLMDMSKNGGVWVYPDEQMGSRVSLYEYLEPEWKEAIENAYLENMYNPYRYEGKKVGVFNPYEPDLTNEIFVHRGNEGTPVGVWISFEEKKEGIPSIVTILKVDNEFYSGYRFIFNLGEGQTREGSCEINNETGEITFDVEFPEPEATTYYGIFEVTEGQRDLLRLEYSEGSRPSGFSDNALNFVIRSQRQPAIEMSEENIPPEEPSEPSPSDSATDVPIDANLSWISGDGNIADVVTYDVYFGTSETPSLVSSGQSEQTYDPGPLSYNTKYYWKIVAKDLRGAVTEGLTWNFTTEEKANKPPVASFTYTPEVPLVEQTITFDASSSYDPDGTIVKYEWDFGDGTEKQIGMSLIHSYSTADNYMVTLTVTDDDGLTSATAQEIAVSQAYSLADDLVFDFSETQFHFVDPLESWFVFKFKVTNVGTKNLLLSSRCSCNMGNEVVGLPILAPQGQTPLGPGESMWIKVLPVGGNDCGYDPNILQTVIRTLHIEIQDNNANYYPWERNQVTIDKEIQIEVVNRETLGGDVLIQGIVVDGEGSPIPYAQIDLGGHGAKVPIACDDGGHFSYSIAQVPVYFLIAHQDGYRPVTIEIDGSNVQDFYTITLVKEPNPLSVSSSLLTKVTGNIGFWRCAATADESKLLLVNGMENWEDESLKDQSKLYLLDTNTGEVLWTHDMGWESWSADITDDGRYVVFGTKLEGFQTGPEGFVNYIRLLDGTDGSLIWEKKITTENFPATTTGEFYTRGVKFSHNGEYIFVPIHCEYGYLLNRSDGSIKWHKWVGQNIREVIFTQDDQYVYIPSGSGWLYKLRVENGSEVWKQWIGTWAYVGGFDLSPDEEHIAVGTKVGYLTVINTSDGSIRFTRDIHNGHAHCRFSPDGTKLAVGGEGLMMLDLDGNLLWRYYSEGQIDIRFSKDGRFITTEAGEVFDAHGALIHDIVPSEPPPGCYHQVGWLNSEGTRFLCALRDTPASGNNIIELYRIETNTPPTESNLSSSLQVDFGDIPSGIFPLDKGIKHRFTVKNTGNSSLTVDVCVQETDTGKIINIWPQPPTLCLSPGEEQWLIVPFLFDYHQEDLIPAFGLGQHTYSLKYTFTDHYDPSNKLTLAQDYTFTVLDPEKITGEFTVQGKVVDENGQPVQDAKVVISTGNYQREMHTPSNGTFSFSVPPNPHWWLTASKGGYKDAYAFNLSDNSDYCLRLLPLCKEVPRYEMSKQVVTDIGFWKYAVDGDEQYILFAQGMENWANSDLMVESKLMLYTLNGEEMWEYPMGEQAWGADLSRDGKYAVYASFDHILPLPQPNIPGKIGLLDAHTGGVLWEKEITPDNFPLVSRVPLYGQDSKEVQFSHNSSYIAIGMGRGDVFLLDRETGNILWSYPTEGQVRKIIFSNDDSFLYVGSGDGRLYKLSTNNGSLQWVTHIWAWPYTYGLALSPDESLIAAGVKTGEVCVVKTSDGTRLWDYDLGIMCVRWVQFSPDGTLLAAGSGAPGGTTIFNATNGTPIWRTCFSGAGMFTSDGKYVLLGDGQGRLYTADGTLVATLDPGFDTASGYWKVAYISRDKSKMVFAARDMEPGGVGIAFFKRRQTGTGVSAPSAHTDLAAHFSLAQNYPNPFNSTTIIRYYLPHQTNVLLEVYDIMGQRVAVLADGKQPRGERTVRWDAGDLASGIYLYKLQTDGFCEVRKALLLR